MKCSNLKKSGIREKRSSLHRRTKLLTFVVTSTNPLINLKSYMIISTAGQCNERYCLL
jgi:hypothetical protein